MLVHRNALVVSKVVARENTRYAFAGVQLSRTRDGKPRATATDGRRALIAEWDEPEAFPPVFGDGDASVPKFSTIIPPEDLARVAKSLPKINAACRLGEFIALHEPSANGSVQLAATGGENVTRATVSSVEGQFPPVDDVVPQTTIEIHVAHDPADYSKPAELKIATEGSDPADWYVVRRFNAKLLREMLQAVESASEDSSRPVDFYLPLKPNKPLVIKSGDPCADVRLTGILMPMNR